MKDVKLYGIYTISPLHYGTGQTAGAVDLPVARESHTGLPFVPGTGLKGVARDVFEQNNKEYVESLFGSRPPQPGGAQDGTAAPNDARSQEAGGGAGASGKAKEGAELRAGNLLFTDARLLALPVRSLQRPFLYVTSPLVLRRLERELHAYNVPGFLPESWVRPKPRSDGDDGSRTGDGRQALVADTNLAGHPLVLEDLCYDAGHVLHQAMVEKLAERFVKLLAADEALGRDLMPCGLVVVPDEDLADLAQRTLPVVARTQLTPGKTTDDWTDHLGLYGRTEGHDVQRQPVVRRGSAPGYAALRLRGRPRSRPLVEGGRETDRGAGKAGEEIAADPTRRQRDGRRRPVLVDVLARGGRGVRGRTERCPVASRNGARRSPTRSLSAPAATTRSSRRI